MILVVADTGPLCHLILIEAIWLLPRLYNQIQASASRDRLSRISAQSSPGADGKATTILGTPLALFSRHNRMKSAISFRVRPPFRDS
jgi:hypothetical protein